MSVSAKWIRPEIVTHAMGNRVAVNMNQEMREVLRLPHRAAALLLCTAALTASASACDTERIAKAKQDLTRAMITHDETAAMYAASDGFNAEADGCSIEPSDPPTQGRAKHVASFVRFTLYGYVYGGKTRRDFLTLGKSYVDDELATGVSTGATRKELLDLQESINEKLAAR